MDRFWVGILPTNFNHFLVTNDAVNSNRSG